MKVFSRVEDREIESRKVRKLDGKVRKKVDSIIDNKEEEIEGEYHITTFGAAAAHVLKFKSGGLSQLQLQFEEKAKVLAKMETRTKKEDEKEKGPEKIRARKMKLLRQTVETLEVHFQILRRQDFCFSQILPAVATCFHQELILNRKNKEILRQYTEIGFLCHFESLLSTYQNEKGMLGDHEMAIHNFVARIQFRFVEDQSEGKHSQLSIEWVAGNHTSDLESIYTSLAGITVGKESEDDGLGMFGAAARNGRENLLITLPLRPEVFRDICHVMRERGREKVVCVVPVFFTQGINEQQTLAIKFSDTSMQERINKDNVNIFALYFQKFRRLEIVSEKVEGLITELFAEMMQIVKTSHREKNVRILSLTADIARLMNGGRLTSCKSAKDRTSMSATWEQVRILTDYHHLSREVFGEAMSVMRSAGVRRENAYKNIGKNKFAFNSLQLQLIPDIYRAPKGSGGAEVT
eukprot:CAMPEP_0201504522 /NCGR_PEP_ID=MMETSP0151_2-20130828/85254_1 /ASSEMBLY_ACC=CAM_ASM_000257 /TAXON_ID=200890 /ORGANISM="Paramoeba atlantica, Strain 621/1 / CCAP 1560/9" /LENGTH=464 /DNA_ID=CAMNT_0047898271 /DNA_START=1285 /DNA_END=2679 /DNA_ORIENTATION=+